MIDSRAHAANDKFPTNLQAGAFASPMQLPFYNIIFIYHKKRLVYINTLYQRSRLLRTTDATKSHYSKVYSRLEIFVRRGGHLQNILTRDNNTPTFTN
jgi:hypothetical protein